MSPVFPQGRTRGPMLSFTEIENSDRERSNLEGKITTSVVDTFSVKSCETSKRTSRRGSCLYRPGFFNKDQN